MDHHSPGDTSSEGTPPLRLLVVEDDHKVAELLEESLQAMGYTVTGIARDGAGALASARAERPDLGLLDIGIPGAVDGIDVGRQMGDELGVPVVFVSAQSDEATLRRAREAGSYGFVCKPFTQPSLRSAIELALFRYRTEQRLRRAEERYRLLFLSNVAAVLHETMSGRIVEANPALATLLGYDGPGDLEGRKSHELFADPGRVAEMRSTLEREGQLLNEERQLQPREGGVVWVVENSTLVSNPESGEQEIVRTMVDITERKERELGLERMAYRDPLTDLPNRRALEVRAEQALALAHRRATPAALIFIDLIDFKSVNDHLGHRAGDQLLAQVGRRLQENLRACDTPCRTGGDEFALLLAEVEDRESAVRGAERILERLAVPFLLAGRTVQMDARAGVALFPDDGKDLASLLDQADRAMTRAKEKGGAVVVVGSARPPSTGR